MQKTGWRNDKHVAQWTMTLREYAKPLRSKRIDEVTTADVLAVLQPIWSAKPETASRTRGLIEAVLDAAKASEHRTGENPARWRGHLALLLPKAQKLSRGHHAAMPVGDVPDFVTKLRNAPGVGVLALEFSILTAARSGEVRGARWGEIDTDKALWTVPAARMKSKKEHRVPLVDRALEVLRAVAELRRECDGDDAIVFPGTKHGVSLSDITLAAAMKRNGAGVYTVHGFRSSFRDWAGDNTAHPREVAEAALAHVVGGVEGAYRRDDALEKRRLLMDAWATFLSPRVVNVVPLKRATA
jgi:integrase